MSDMTPDTPAKKPKVAFADMRVRIFAPLDERDPHIALIGSLPMLFYGATPMQASRKAKEWRTVEISKERKRGSRQNDVIPAPDPLALTDE